MIHKICTKFFRQLFIASIAQKMGRLVTPLARNDDVRLHRKLDLKQIRANGVCLLPTREKKEKQEKAYWPSMRKNSRRTFCASNVRFSHSAIVAFTTSAVCLSLPLRMNRILINDVWRALQISNRKHFSFIFFSQDWMKPKLFAVYQNFCIFSVFSFFHSFCCWYRFFSSFHCFHFVPFINRIE